MPNNLLNLRDVVDYKGKRLTVVGFTINEVILQSELGSVVYVRHEWVLDNCVIL
jgi:hypothetical protein